MMGAIGALRELVARGMPGTVNAAPPPVPAAAPSAAYAAPARSQLARTNDPKNSPEG
jgi:hypothetical protein